PQLVLLGPHGQATLLHGLDQVVAAGPGPPGDALGDVGRRHLLGHRLDLPPGVGRTDGTGGGAGHEPGGAGDHRDTSLRRRRRAAFDVPLARATVLMTGVLSAARATREAPSTFDEIASAEPSTRSN